MIRRSSLMIAALLALSAGVAAGQNPWSLPTARGDELTIKLVTIEPGDELYAWWGHSGLIVEDRRSGVSQFYDYGRFSFRQEHFYTNFIRGRLLFEVGVVPTQFYLEHYRNLNRTVRIQTLAFEPDRRLALARALDEDVLPENRVYLYDHYYDNCATRLRDLINEYSGLALRETAIRGSGTTFREVTRNYTQHALLVDFLFMYLMSDVIDREMSVWETMFLPDRLESVVAEVTIRAGGGSFPFVTSTNEFNTAVGRRSIPTQAPPLELPSLLVGLALGSIALIGSLLSLKRLRAGSIIEGVAISIAGVISGVLGSLLFFMSLFTDHVVTHGNENIVFTNPLSFLLLVAGVLVARRRGRTRGVSLAFFVTGAFLVVTALFSLLKLVMPGLDQQNWPAIAFFGANYLLLFLASTIPFLRLVRERRTLQNR